MSIPNRRSKRSGRPCCTDTTSRWRYAFAAGRRYPADHQRQAGPPSLPRSIPQRHTGRTLVRNTNYSDIVWRVTSDRNRDDYHIEELRDALVQISFALMAVLTEVAAEHNLSLTQLRVLGILRDREPTMADLATFTGLERSTVSGLIDRAAQRGLVAKTADPHDGRSVRVTLTEPARRLVPEITAAIGTESRR